MIRITFILITFVLPVLLTSCARVTDQWLTGLEASAAKNQIMLIRETPPSFGYQRLSTQARSYPDLGIFIEQNGLPDFLAETANNERQYLILYYLQQRHAYACRTKSPRSRAIEFAGPYPITQREYVLLDGFQTDSVKKREER